MTAGLLFDLPDNFTDHHPVYATIVPPQAAACRGMWALGHTLDASRRNRVEGGMDASAFGTPTMQPAYAQVQGSGVAGIVTPYTDEETMTLLVVARPGETPGSTTATNPIYLGTSKSGGSGGVNIFRSQASNWIQAFFTLSDGSTQQAVTSTTAAGTGNLDWRVLIAHVSPTGTALFDMTAGVSDTDAPPAGATRRLHTQRSRLSVGSQTGSTYGGKADVMLVGIWGGVLLDADERAELHEMAQRIGTPLGILGL